VLRVDLTRKQTSLTPLVHSIAERQPLSALAKGHKHLVAASNTGYFDFYSGAPTQPFVSAKAPMVMSTAHQRVVGVDAAGLAESGMIWLDGTVTVGKKTHALAAINELDPPTGIALYTSKWGSARVPAHRGDVYRNVVKGAVTSSRQSFNDPTVPSGGALLVANGQSASQWLSSLSSGSKMSVVPKVQTDAPKPFVQAYGAGVQLVATAGFARTGFSCDSIRTKQPARTAVGFTAGGRTLVEAFVNEQPYTDKHGLDNDQMSKLMEQLGVSQAYEFDGSGSTELLAKLPGSSRVTLQTYPADGAERPMPLGVGVLVAPTKTHKKH
jgi:hypothetical protein